MRGRQRGAGRDLEQLGGVVAHEFEGVAPLDQAEALGDQAFELDRLDFGAVLLGLAAALRLFVAVEFAFDAVDLAVEQVDERPQEIGEIVFEAGAGEHGAEGFDRGVQLALDGVGLGQRPRIGFVLAGAMAAERELIEQMRGRARRCAVRLSVSLSEKGKVLSLRDMAGAFLAGGSAALIAAFTAIPLPEAETVLHPQGRSAAEDGSGPTILFRDAKPPP